jgi:hypothetical protein
MARGKTLKAQALDEMLSLADKRVKADKADRHYPRYLRS